MNGLLLTVFFLSHHLNGFCAYAVCTINMKNDDKLPLVLRDIDTFYLPTGNGVILFANGDVVTVGCPGSRVVVSGNSKYTELENAICMGPKFRIKDKIVDFDDIRCSSKPEIVVYDTEEHCLGNKMKIEIGFWFSAKKKFIKQIIVCFDNIRKIALYSHYQLSSAINDGQCNRPDNFHVDPFHIGLSIGEIYKADSERKTINALVGQPQSSTLYIDKNKQYLVKGHLAPCRDFVFYSQRRTTMYYVNAAPQWNKLNNGKWKTLENYCRTAAWQNNINYFVFTGTHGTLEKQRTDLYLYTLNNQMKVPIPKLFWKVLYLPLPNTGKLKGVAFVGFNDPFLTLATIPHICTDICHRLRRQITWDNNNPSSGIVLCCEVNDLRTTVPSVPYKVSQLLQL